MLESAEYTQTRLVEFKKGTGMYWNGREDEEITEYSGYLLTQTPCFITPEQKYFTIKEKAEEGFNELKRILDINAKENKGRKRYQGRIMRVWFFYSKTLGMLSHRQRGE